jgi:hypothetical protein
MVRAVAISLMVSACLFAALTVWTNHTTAATHETSHAFAQNAKSICDHAPHTKTGLQQAADELAKLHEPPNVHRAVARLELHWHRLLELKPGTKAYRAEMKQARLSADLLNIEACRRIEPR